MGIRYNYQFRAQVTGKACAFLRSASFGLAAMLLAIPSIAQMAPIIPAAPAQTAVPSAPSSPNAPMVMPSFTVPSATVPGVAPAAPETSAPEATGRIARITISGNANVTTAAISAVIAQSGLKVGSDYDQATAQVARDTVKAMGYFNGDVGLAADPDPAGGVDVAFTVKENPVVKTIKFTANTPTGEPTIPADKLKSLMQTQEGRVLNTNILVQDLDKLFNHQTGYVRQQGYIFDVSSDINVDPISGTLTIPLVEAHIDAIQVKGNKKTKPIVITREFRSVPGEVLDEKKLQKDLTRVYNLGLFDQVGPFDEVPTDVGKVIVSVPVTEKRSGQVSVGVGYSSTAKLVGRAELAENNFRGMGERVSLQWEVGGVNSRSSLELGFFEPYLDKRHTSLNVDLYDKAIYRFSSNTFSGGSTSGSSNTYIENHRGVTLGVNRPLSDFATGGLSFRTETVATDNVQLQTTDQFIRQQGNVTAFGAHAAFSNRDNDFAPAAGGLRDLSYEMGIANTTTVGNAPSPLSPGRHNFGKVGFDLRQYSSLNGPRKAGNFNQPKRVLATRLLLGFTNRNIPFFEQYFLGGADSLRGYDTDRYWGTSLALFQAELRIPVGKDNNFQGVLLFDGGDAWNSIYQAQGLSQHTQFKLESDYGVGIRLVTPIGPIRLDFAIPTTGTSKSPRTQFSIGQSF